jgi:hypothetical protein
MFAEYEPRFASSFDVDPGLQAGLADSMFGGRVLLRALLAKAWRRIGLRRSTVRPAAVYNGLVVFDEPGLNGGGLVYEQLLYRFLTGIGIPACDHAYEFCAGPGYIGYSLLAHGFCRRLTLSDISPAAMETAKHTAVVNGVAHLVNTYVSDGLREIPPTEQWDLVVGTPPLLLPANTEESTRYTNRPGWGIQAEFYASICKYMRPGGRVVMFENSDYSSAELFEPMIASGGGSILHVVPCTEIPGGERDKYFIVTQW